MIFGRFLMRAGVNGGVMDGRRFEGFSFDAIAAGRLGAVEGLIGRTEQRLHILPSGFEDGRNSHANRDRQGEVTKRNGLEETTSRSRSACTSPGATLHPGATIRNSSPPKRPTAS